MVLLVPDEGLSRLNVKPSLPTYMRHLWKRRHFIRAEAKSKAFSSGRDTYLGKLWVLLDPIFQVIFYGIVFGLILQISRGIENFVGFLVIGVVYFGFIAKGLNSGATLIQRSRNLITAFNFPRSAIALSTSFRLVLDGLLPALVSVTIALAFQYDKPISWSVVLIVPLYILIQVFGLGAIFLIARITAFIPDFKSIVALFTRGLFFLSGVFFSIERFDTNPTLQKIVELNPVYQFLMAVRTVVLDGRVPTAGVWIYLAAWSFSLLFFGFLYFWQAEERYSNVR